jgi:predicted dehydrogenase
MELVGVGFIGLGGLTQTRHLPAIARIAGARVAGGADVSDQLRRTVARRHNFEFACEDYRELLARPDVDAVYINLPASQRPQATLDALAAGKHVFCEKPMAIAVAEAERMVEAARDAGRFLMIGLNQRFARRSILMREAIRAGSLGRPYFIKAGMLQHNGEPSPQSWLARRALSGGGALIDQGSSMIDLALWLLDFPEVESASGVVGKHILGDDYDVEDFAAVSLKLEGGVGAHLELAWVYNGGPLGNKLYVDVYGSQGGARGRARWSADGPPLTLYRRGEGDQISSQVIEFESIDSHLEQDRHFIDCARGAIEPQSRPQDALRSLRVIEEIYRQNGMGATAPSSQGSERPSRPLDASDAPAPRND